MEAPRSDAAGAEGSKGTAGAEDSKDEAPSAAPSEECPLCFDPLTRETTAHSVCCGMQQGVPEGALEDAQEGVPRLQAREGGDVTVLFRSMSRPEAEGVTEREMTW